MTEGTSPHGGGLSRRWADAGQWEIGWQRPAWRRLLALGAIAGLAVGLVLTAGWHAVAAILLAACAAAACAGLGLRPAEAVPLPNEPAPEAPSQLLAQMSHDLRTPLNAMIGFSEAMQRELHGPLGSARYQEYAAHITESGGRLLKAFEDAIAVAATMSALLADRSTLRRERLPAAGLVHEAWAALGASERAIRLSVEGCAAVEVECNRQATSQALQHLLAEAVSRAAPSGVVTARSVSDGGSIELAAEASIAMPAEDGLRVILARSLIEMQGGTLSLCEPHAGRWSLRVGFPAAPPTLKRRRRPTSAAPRRPGAPVRRGGFAAAAASHANAGSRAAPPA